MLKAKNPKLAGERRSDLELEVRRDLVNTLYASTRSLAAGALAGGAITITVAVKSGFWPLAVAAGLVSLVGCARIVLSVAYKAAERDGRVQGEIWEGAYQLGAAGYSGLLGLFAMLTLLLVRDPMLHMLATTTAIGYAAGITGRNAGRPKVAVTQLTLAALPVSVGLLLTPNGLYRMLGVVMLLFYGGMIDIMLQTYDVVLRAFRNARENQALVEAVQIKVNEARAANEAKTRFLANMSHEIRTPLNGVLGMTEVMLADPLSDQQRMRLKVIRQSGGALLTLLNDILDLSKVEAGKLEIASAPFDLGDLLDSVSTAFQDTAAKRHIAFSVVASEADLGMYEGDSGRLRQILFNLISNALKFTEAGSVKVNIAYNGQTLDMTVSDTGIGIASEQLDRLFQRFSQADASTTRRFGGTGLGLAICQELTKLLSGRIWAESRLGDGATFFVSIPLVRLSLGETATAPSPLPVVPITSPAVEAMTERKIRLLCAEDNEVNQMVLKALLEPFDYELIVVDDGLQALEAYKREVFDLILLDIQMPVMDGPTAAAAIRLHEADTNQPNIPIIALTANVMADQVQSYLTLGMNQVVPKPINIDELYGAIQRHLYDGASDGDAGVPDRIAQHSAVAG